MMREKESKQRKCVPQGHKTLHVLIPESVFDKAKGLALIQGKSWKCFVVEALEKSVSEIAEELISQAPMTSSSE